MRKMSHVKRAVLCAVCIALCYVLPVAFHALNLGTALSPMHIPVLLCGLVCGGGYGLVCGLAGPVLSCLLTGMPSATKLITMAPELMVYGLAGGLVLQYVRTKNLYADLYIALVSAMLLGRIVGGIASALFYLGTDSSYSISVWATSYFVSALPGIVAHLIVVPVLVIALTKARLIPQRYE